MYFIYLKRCATIQPSKNKEAIRCQPMHQRPPKAGRAEQQDEKGANDDEEFHIAGAYLCTHAGHSDGLKTAIERIGKGGCDDEVF
jgi:hypothetical protein